ncbi:MAG: metalloregulator ArsR/SmtB family transcription factor [Armatimonadetes bacterium]|nr:metalloregulator ArsR/SmtB family transcription factor [Armatimonadota bacterium]NIM22817.1 metalloregulator ArsR/SmtB family transcription factor [Armatimonadota bacterium]NIM66684.1 metalloregulator ArsR/SmtB family transcription factor [Armatimonadota bacterium]NIM75241.1 metalloregulator ArsR/SmtB family transcription factor [Armatimonadota bacterium]NIN04882.1 metalloregulator ArsR/SmtB family transcription factor [Armatimonadota bacterium]
MKRTARNLTEILKVMCDPTRLRILEALSGGPVCVSALADAVGISQSAVSQHLRVLRQAGLVTAEKRGYWVHYQTNRNALKTLFSQFEQWCGQVCEPPKSACPTAAQCRKTPRHRSTKKKKGDLLL